MQWLLLKLVTLFTIHSLYSAFVDSRWLKSHENHWLLQIVSGSRRRTRRLAVRWSICRWCYRNVAIADKRGRSAARAPTQQSTPIPCWSVPARKVAALRLASTRTLTVAPPADTHKWCKRTRRSWPRERSLFDGRHFRFLVAECSSVFVWNTRTNDAALRLVFSKLVSVERRRLLSADGLTLTREGSLRWLPPAASARRGNPGGADEAGRRERSGLRGEACTRCGWFADLCKV